MGLVRALVGLVLLCGVPVWARAQKAPPVLVELFTSEGCSSCPPADDLLRAVNGRVVDGRTIIGLSEHVTYWNRLGWADPFSAETFTERQNSYAQRLRQEDVYTPQMVVNGREPFVGSDGPALRAALHKEIAQPMVPLEIEGVERGEKDLIVRLRVGELPAGASLRLMGAVTDDARMSEVRRGENAGRVLRHVAVVRSLTMLAEVPHGGEQTVRVPVLGEAGMGQSVVVFLQGDGVGPVMGAAVGAVP